MPANYPSGLDSFTTHHDGLGEAILAGDINKIQDAIAALETELGLTPKGSSADVAARLASLLKAASNLSDLASASTARTNLGLGTAATISSTAGGDLSGTLPSPTVAKVNGIAVSGAPSASGQVLAATGTTAAAWSNVQFRRNTAALWTSTNPVLTQGEPGLETDTKKFKIGDGTTAWTSLAYVAQQIAADSALTSVYAPWTAAELNVSDPQFAGNIQAAINAAATLGIRQVYLPHGTYTITAALTNSGSSRMRLIGESADTTIINVAAGYVGALVAPTAGFEIANLTLSGSGIDGCYGVAASSGGFGRLHITDVNIGSVEYGIKIDGTAQLPLIAVFRNLYIAGFRSCGIKAAPTTNNGQSAWTLDNIVCTNGASRTSVPAAGFSQTDDSPDSTHDALTWSGTDDTEFGYSVLRLPVGSTDTNAWTWVATVVTGTTSYSASKTAGVYYTYRVVRNTTGTYLRYGKTVDIGAIQNEYVGTGLWVRDCTGVNIATVYTEYRGSSLTSPVPKGDGVLLTTSTGVSISGGWVEQMVSAINSVDSSAVEVRGIRANDCQRSVVHYSGTSADHPLTVAGVSATGTTPVKVSTDGSAFSHNIAGNNVFSVDASLANRWHVDHTTLAEIEMDFRGARSAVLGVDSTSAYTWLSSATPPTASSTYDGQIRRNGSSPYICVNAGAGYAWYALVRDTAISNSSTTFLTGKRTDSSAVGSFGYDGGGQPTATASSSGKDFLVTTGGVRVGASGPFWRAGTGSPEGVLTAPIGSLWTRTDGGASTTLYVKESGAGNTGWIARTSIGQNLYLAANYQ